MPKGNVNLSDFSHVVFPFWLLSFRLFFDSFTLHPSLLPGLHELRSSILLFRWAIYVPSRTIALSSSANSALSSFSSGFLLRAADFDLTSLTHLEDHCGKIVWLIWRDSRRHLVLWLISSDDVGQFACDLLSIIPLPHPQIPHWFCSVLHSQKIPI
jgi:hypothetical protein